MRLRVLLVGLAAAGFSCVQLWPQQYEARTLFGEQREAFDAVAQALAADPTISRVGPWLADPAEHVGVARGASAELRPEPDSELARLVELLENPVVSRTSDGILFSYGNPAGQSNFTIAVVLRESPGSQHPRCPPGGPPVAATEGHCEVELAPGWALYYTWAFPPP